MNISITGATGFIGKHLVNNSLKDKNVERIKILTRKKQENLSSDTKKVIQIEGDLLSLDDDFSKFLSDTEILIHLAARMAPPQNKIFFENVQSTYNLYSRAFNYKEIKKTIYISSAPVYGEGGQKPFTEEDALKPETVYGLSKLFSEEIVKFWSRRSNGAYLIFRPFNIYGPGNFKGVIWNFWKSIQDSNKVTLFGNGLQRRDFLFVEDFVDAIAKGLYHGEGIFNIGSGEDYSLIEIVEIFKKVTKNEIEIDYAKEEEGKVNRIKLDIAKVKRELKWRPVTSIIKGIQKTLKSYNTK